jgi:hypothetical protein
MEARMLARAAALVAVVVAGCAGPQKTAQIDSLTMSNSGLYLGHSTQGDIVIAATHYDAMSGLATTADELGLAVNDDAKDKNMMCARETPTGTHVPRWICRYQADIARERVLTRDWLDQPRLSFSGRPPALILVGRGGGSNNRGTYVP